MSWRDEWPGPPPDGTGADSSDEQSDDGDDESDGPFRVVLADSACETSAAVAALRADGGEIRSYASRAAARADLLEGAEAAGLRFQRAAPNDPRDVDAYLVWVREPEPAPDERGPPEGGWAVDVRGQQVGAMAEALFAAYRRNPPPIRAYAARDLGLDVEDVVVEVEDEPAAVEAPVPEFSGRWLPDFAFVVRRGDGEGSATGGRLLKRYLAEVKHGDASFERDQRAVMEAVAADAGPGLDVLVIRVDLAAVPESVDVSIRAL